MPIIILLDFHSVSQRAVWTVPVSGWRRTEPWRWGALQARLSNPKVGRGSLKTQLQAPLAWHTYNYVLAIVFSLQSLKGTISMCKACYTCHLELEALGWLKIPAFHVKCQPCEDTLKLEGDFHCIETHSINFNWAPTMFNKIIGTTPFL